jgi:hypothetical protein
MLQVLFHSWERRLASVTTDRVARPFEWGLEWIPQNGHGDGSPYQDRETRPQDLLRRRTRKTTRSTAVTLK